MAVAPLLLLCMTCLILMGTFFCATVSAASPALQTTLGGSPAVKPGTVLGAAAAVASPSPSGSLAAYPILVKATAPPAPAGLTWLGCYKDGADSTIVLLSSSAILTVDMCKALAAGSNLRYLLLQDATYCYGGNDLTNLKLHGQATNCDKPCPGNTQQVCGGNHAVSVYDRLASVSPSPIPSPSPVPSPPRSPSPTPSPYISPSPKLPPVPSPTSPPLSSPRPSPSPYPSPPPYQSPVSPSYPFTTPASPPYSPPSMLTPPLPSPSPFPSSSPYSSPASLPVASPQPSPPSPTGGIYMVGCYKEDYPRGLPTQLAWDGGMTVEKCASLAAAANLKYFGVEWSTQCWGGSELGPAVRYGPSKFCSSPCAGNSSQVCGGDGSVSLYSIGPMPTVSPPPVPSPQPAPAPTILASATYLGCFVEQLARGLPTQLGVGGMTPQKCRDLAVAANYRYFGVEYSEECWGGNDYTQAVQYGASTTCIMPCRGDPLQVCGGRGTFNLYAVGDAQTLSPTPSPPSSPYASTVPSPVPSPVPPPAPAPPPSIIAGATYVGCYMDQLPRALPSSLGYGAAMTPQKCRDMATAAGLRYFGLQYGEECWAGSNYTQATQYGSATACIMPCSGDALQVCGGRGTFNLYDRGDAPSPPPPAFPSPDPLPPLIPSPSPSPAPAPDAVHLGCYGDTTTAAPAAGRFLATDTRLTLQRCRDWAAANSLRWFAVEGGTNCYGNNDYASAIKYGPRTTCTTPCAGNSTQICGGAVAFNLYDRGAAAPDYPPPPPTIMPGTVYVGCYKDAAQNSPLQVLYNRLAYNSSMTPQLCRDLAVAGNYRYFGVLQGFACQAIEEGYTGSFALATRWGPATNCNMRCAGDNNQVCGGTYAFNLYARNV